MNRRELVAARFEALFDCPLEVGERRLRYLLGNAISMDRFTRAFDPAQLTGSKVSMSERDFALIAFFSLVGVGALSEVGIEEVPDPELPEVIIVPQDSEERRSKIRELRKLLGPGEPPDDVA